ncbi:hypothetical protein FKW77_000545 [Venturia effusa]|uniref:Uncharacterized protein n=1 Tax=Venturia effusa TaxID=50376 RepID=A0A517L0P2_9PEZI|nr:hypothetical protein FKW77_000545 [Venturia effusa]
MSTHAPNELAAARVKMHSLRLELDDTRGDVESKDWTEDDNKQEIDRPELEKSNRERGMAAWEAEKTRVLAHATPSPPSRHHLLSSPIEKQSRSQRETSVRAGASRAPGSGNVLDEDETSIPRLPRSSFQTSAQSAQGDAPSFSTPAQPSSDPTVAGAVHSADADGGEESE